MLRRRLVLAALSAMLPVAAAEASTLSFTFMNCVSDEGPVDVRAYDGADTVRMVPASEKWGLPWRASHPLHCLSGSQPWDTGCQLRINRNNAEYSFRIAGDTCFKFEWNMRPYPMSDCRC